MLIDKIFSSLFNDQLKKSNITVVQLIGTSKTINVSRIQTVGKVKKGQNFVGTIKCHR